MILFLFLIKLILCRIWGQIGDSGKILDLNGNLVGEISDTKKNAKGVFFHFLSKSFGRIETTSKYTY